MNLQVRIYGAEWCHDTQRTRAHLEERGVEYQFIDIDEDAHAEEQVMEASGGKRKIPLVEVKAEGATRRMVEPTNAELDRALEQRAA
jgi:glutaredoxin